jgi:hypothetical protein
LANVDFPPPDGRPSFETGMTVVRCPRCRDEVTVPNGATERALVRCPLCLEQYLLAEALANAPPLLAIIGGEVKQHVLAASSQPGSHDEAEGDYRFAAPHISGASHVPVTAATAAPSAGVALARPAIRTGRRAQRKEKSGLLFLVNVVAGGLLAAPLALLTLWWVFGVDPEELGPLGPKVAQYAPWIVPASLRGRAVTEESNSGPATAETKKRERGGRETGRMRSPDEASGLQTLPGLDPAPALTEDTMRPLIEGLNMQPTPKKRSSSGLSGVQVESASKTDDRAEQKPAPPMPDLRDLLP